MTSSFSTSLKQGQLVSHTAKQQGSALVIAIFVIVVMALISAALTVMLQDTSRNAAWDVLGTRAELAAYSGLEQSLSELFPLNTPNTTPGNCSDVTPNPTLNGQAFGSCSVAVTCQKNDIAQLNARFFDLQATASCGSGEVLVQRSQQIQARSGL
ncbi:MULTISPECIES: hypothetical protein [unclassified Agarivorans]|uniref:hypothetical protein n=1 Tax=unclassified Agarivorans TaxID=2636026 RepID=UPI0026E38BA9|nr:MULTISPECIES: hypothetical protein [unclassified Agarivorans]MDO6686854.1 hypothetical protein [Agarivorans sp. 3_MG-2023]MDO6716651.1 hypothetical protein [Agarivorans sp. 2_MG-2023]